MLFTPVVAPAVADWLRLPTCLVKWCSGLALILLPPFMVSAALAADPKVTLSTNLGDIVLELDERRAPLSVSNFLDYVDSGFYNNTLFHRVIEGFVIQGGGFDQNYQKKSTNTPISNEAYNGLRNIRYSIAMARTTAPHSATSQFFINSEDNRNLDYTNSTQRGWGYAVFGRVVEGMDVVDAISRVATGPGGPFSRDAPIEPVFIISATRHEVAIPNKNSVPSLNANPPASAAAKASDEIPSMQKKPAAEQMVEQN